MTFLFFQKAHGSKVVKDDGNIEWRLAFLNSFQLMLFQIVQVLLKCCRVKMIEYADVFALDFTKHIIGFQVAQVADYLVKNTLLAVAIYIAFRHHAVKA